MIVKSIPRSSLKTTRLTLRPSSGIDADRAFQIRSDWEVSRMLSNALFPPDRRRMEEWFSQHEKEWNAGTAYRFAIEHAGQLIGIVDLDGVTEHGGKLGYWLDWKSWGNGYAFEAARALLRFVFTEAGLPTVDAGHAEDNVASGRVLTKLGFTEIGSIELFSRSRCEDIKQRRYVLSAQDFFSSHTA